MSHHRCRQPERQSHLMGTLPKSSLTVQRASLSLAPLLSAMSEFRFTNNILEMLSQCY